MLRRSFALVSFLLLISFLFSISGRSEASKRATFEPELPAMARLQRDSGGRAVISHNRATGVASFVRLPREGGTALALTAGRSAEAEAWAFLEHYGEVFGVQDARQDLQLVGKQGNVAGQTRLTFTQSHEGVDVFAGMLRVQLDENNRVLSANGTIVPGVKVHTTPSLTAETAIARAVAHVQRQTGVEIASSNLADVNSHLYLFREGLVQRVVGDVRLVYEVEVVNSDITVREFVYVDAHSGAIVDQITGIHEDLDRKVSEGSLANVVWEDSAGNPDPIPAGWAGGSAAQISAWQDEIDGTRETYNLFVSMAGRDTYDGAGATMRTVNNAAISCPNATWNGTSTNYCNGVTADDVVAHEWGHAYTEYTNGLIYQWQSGALNESYSDIWGETVDLLNGRGADAPNNARTAGSCSLYGAGTPKTDDSYRWLMGEDATAFPTPIRDMWNPNCNGHPGKVTDTAQYVCTDYDNGGVHINSGIPNHAFALMVDGGTFNGQTITGLGLTKVAHIHWEAQNMLTPASDFVDQADALEAACSNLMGVNLPALSTDSADAGFSGQTITAADCQEVADAIAAVELRTEPALCNFEPLLDPEAPALCEGLGEVESIFSEDWEGGVLPAGWSVGTYSVAQPGAFRTPDWSVVSDLPRGASGSYAAFVPNLITGDCSYSGDDQQTGALYLESPVITVPGGVETPRLAFDHWVATELGWDGGQIRISVNGGPWILVPASAFDFNAYNATLKPGGAGNTNPLAGQSAFTGSDGGATGGSWGQSQIDLSGFAVPGDEVQLRFVLGVDICYGQLGWYVDDLSVFACQTEVVPPEIDVSPTSLEAILDTGHTSTQQATITNVGGADLEWTVKEAAGDCGTYTDISWLTVSPLSGTTTFGTGNDVDVNFDATGAPGGVHAASLCVASNDPATPEVKVPVELTVPVVNSVQLGQDQTAAGLVGRSVTYTVEITNTGNVTDTFDLSLSGNVWNATLSQTSAALDAGASTTVGVSVDVPAGAAEGEVDTVLLSATSQGDPGQSDSLQLETTASTDPPTYGVTLGPDQTATGYVGQSVTYTLQIMNTGNVADTFTLGVNGNAWNTARRQDSVALNAGAGTTLEVIVSVPDDADAGDVDTAVVTVLSEGHPDARDWAVLQTTASWPPPGPWRIYVPAINRP